MYKIGEFSTLSKTTIKALRYYEKEGIFRPSFIDSNGYRYYESQKLLELSKITSLRQVGFSIEEIKQIKSGADINELLLQKQKELENLKTDTELKLNKIQYLLGGKTMEYEIILKDLPNYEVYYKEGTVKNFGEISNFILSSANECLATNPNIKCVEPDYCFVEYLDGEFKESDIKVRYSQAVTQSGKPNETIKFRQLQPVKAVCTYHKGAYENLGKAYASIMQYIEENHLKIADFPRERYIDGIWNKEQTADWLTEIQVPIEF